MIELYSIRDVARILAVQEARLRYWMQTGFVGPTVRKGGRFYYTFCDLVAVKAAKDLGEAGLPLQKIAAASRRSARRSPATRTPRAACACAPTARPSSRSPTTSPSSRSAARS